MWTLISPTWIKTLWPLPVLAAHIVGSYWMLSLFCVLKLQLTQLKKKRKKIKPAGIEQCPDGTLTMWWCLIVRYMWVCELLNLGGRRPDRQQSPERAFRKGAKVILFRVHFTWKGLQCTSESNSLGVSVISGMRSTGYQLRNKAYLFVYFCDKEKQEVWLVWWHPECFAAPACIWVRLFESAWRVCCFSLAKEIYDLSQDWWAVAHLERDSSLPFFFNLISCFIFTI